MCCHFCCCPITHSAVRVVGPRNGNGHTCKKRALFAIAGRLDSDFDLRHSGSLVNQVMKAFLYLREGKVAGDAHAESNQICVRVTGISNASDNSHHICAKREERKQFFHIGYFINGQIIVPKNT